MTIISTDSLLLSHVVEATPGVTPATPAFKNWRTTGETLTFSPEVQENTELGSTGRSMRPSNLTGTSIGGDINFVLAKFDALEEAIAGVLAAAWGECPLTGAAGGAVDSANRITVGKDLPTFTIQKRFPNPANVEGAMDIAAVVSGAPGATPDITFSNGPAVGSGVVVVDYAVDSGQSQRIHVDISPTDTITDVATAVAAALDAQADLGATATLGVVDITTTGTSVTSLTCRVGKDEYLYQRYRGATYSVLNLTTAPNDNVTGSVSIIGGEPELDYLEVTGATYASAGNSPIFTAPEVLELNMGASLGVLTACWSSLTINLDSGNRPIPCIGSIGDREVATGLLAATISGDVYFTSFEPLEALLSNEVIGDGNVTFTNADDEVYRFDFFDVKIIQGELTAGATNQDLTLPLEFEPTPVAVCDDGSGNDWEASLIVSLVNSAPTLP